MASKKRRSSVSRRIDVAPEGGVLAKLGFYTRPVQFVARRWRGKVSDELVEEYFRAVAKPIVLNGSVFNVNMHFRCIIRQHWPLVFELGAAISKVVLDECNIDKWLLTQPWSVAMNGEWESWDSIAEFIGKRVGQKNSKNFANTVKQRAKRLKLLTPPKLAREFLSVTGRTANS